jgi:glycosyltransferase involved in cell wall biosynthesis
MRLERQNNPLAAIVTPVYNGAAFLAETMACVQAQTYPNLVHVVVDNASTDATSDIIAGFLGGRVPVLRSRNPETVPAGRNWSIAVANVPAEAKYFQILCADDLLRPDSVEKMVAVAEADQAVELVGSAQERGGHVGPVGLPRGQQIFDGAAVARAFLNKESNDVPHVHGLFRRHKEDLEGDFFDFPYSCFDTDACLRALSRGKFGFVHEALHTFRIHDAQASNVFLRQNRASVWESLVEIRRWAPKVMSPAEADQCFRRHLRVVCRYMLAWRALGNRAQYSRHRQLLQESGIKPNMRDYLESVIEWPAVELSDQWSRLSRRRRWRADNKSHAA